ncbi:uncharacterized protein LOC100185155 [Ciona intestinalis]
MAKSPVKESEAGATTIYIECTEDQVSPNLSVVGHLNDTATNENSLMKEPLEDEDISEATPKKRGRPRKDSFNENKNMNEKKNTNENKKRGRPRGSIKSKNSPSHSNVNLTLGENKKGGNERRAQKYQKLNENVTDPFIMKISKIFSLVKSENVSGKKSKNIPGVENADVSGKKFKANPSVSLIKTHVRKFAKESKLSDENNSDTTDTDLEDEEPLISDEEEKNLDSSDSEELMTLSELRERKLSRENNDEFAVDVENEKDFDDSDQIVVSLNSDLNQPGSSPEEIKPSSHKKGMSPFKKVGNRKYALRKVNGSQKLSDKRLAVLRQRKAKLDAKSSVYKATHYANLRAKRVTERTKKRKYTKSVKKTYTFQKANERDGKPVLQSLVLKRKPGRPRKDEIHENNVELYHGKKSRVVITKPPTFKYAGPVVSSMKRNKKLQTVKKSKAFSILNTSYKSQKRNTHKLENGTTSLSDNYVTRSYRQQKKINWGNYQPPKLLVQATSSLSCNVSAVGTQCNEYFEICIQSKQFNTSMEEGDDSDSAPTNIPEETQPYRNFITLEALY